MAGRNSNGLVRRRCRGAKAASLLAILFLWSCGGGGQSTSQTVPDLKVVRVMDAVEAVSEARAVVTNGRVLVTGGDHGVGGVSTVQSYDPVAKTFQLAGSLLQRRFVHSATVSTEGRLIVAGGFNDDIDGRFLRTVEGYEPISGSWQRLPDLCEARDNQHAVALPGGRILFIGGDNDEYGYVSRVEIYDPRVGSDTCERRLAIGRVHEAVVDLPDGFVYVFGGLSIGANSDVRYEASVEKIEKSSGRIAAAGTMRTGRKQFEATALPDGRVLITGGFSDGTPTERAEIYDPRTGTSFDVGPMLEARAGHSATALGNGWVLVAGGVGSSRVLHSTELFDPRAGVFLPGPAMSVARALHVAVPIDGSGVLLSGGYQGDRTYTGVTDLVVRQNTP